MTSGEIGKHYVDGDVIFREGDAGDAMFVIQSGSVKILKSSDAGDITLATLKSGDIFGEMVLFDRQLRSATAVSSGDSRILTVDKKKLFSMISKDPTLVFKILESMSQRIRTLNNDISKLKRIGSGVLGSFDISEVCGAILIEVRNFMVADNGSVMLIEPDDKTLSIRAAFGIESEKKVSLEQGVGIAGDVIRTGQAELVNNASYDTRFVKGDTRITSMLCVPLRHGTRVFGVINLSNHSERLFSLEDLKLLNSLSFYAALAIQNALHLSQFKTVSDELIRHATIESAW